MIAIQAQQKHHRFNMHLPRDPPAYNQPRLPPDRTAKSRCRHRPAELQPEPSPRPTDVSRGGLLSTHRVHSGPRPTSINIAPSSLPYAVTPALFRQTNRPYNGPEHSAPLPYMQFSPFAIQTTRAHWSETYRPARELRISLSANLVTLLPQRHAYTPTTYLPDTSSLHISSLRRTQFRHPPVSSAMAAHQDPPMLRKRSTCGALCDRPTLTLTSLRPLQMGKTCFLLASRIAVPHISDILTNGIAVYKCSSMRR